MMSTEGSTHKAVWRSVRRSLEHWGLRREILQDTEGRRVAIEAEAEERRQRAEVVAAVVTVREERAEVMAPLQRAYEVAMERRQAAQADRDNTGRLAPNRPTLEGSLLLAEALLDEAARAVSQASSSLDMREWRLIAALRESADPRIAEFARRLRSSGNDTLGLSVRSQRTEKREYAGAGFDRVEYSFIDTMESLAALIAGLFKAAERAEALRESVMASSATEVVAALEEIRRDLSTSFRGFEAPAVPTLKEAITAAELLRPIGQVDPFDAAMEVMPA